MCGITGFYQAGAADGEAMVHALHAMAQSLTHRGPDSEGFWVDGNCGIYLGHRRLSIQDLSPLGNQPMLSRSGRYVIIFNGEIYNFLELRADLEKEEWRFKGGSDTEVMLAALEVWGLERALASFTGMFAFALWDREKHELVLARDRLGEKPLYYGWRGNAFLFGSELKALRRHPAWESTINRDAVGLHVRHNYIPAPWSVFEGIFKLLPGACLILDTHTRQHRVKHYWSLEEAFRKGIETPLNLPPAEIADLLEDKLRGIIRRQMIADVPVGAFLSGGIDSSTVVALMQSQRSSPVKTFTIGFNEDEYNEAKFAKAVARHLGTEHTDLYVSPQTVLDVVPEINRIYDEPFADSSQIPTFLISRLTRQHVTVSLSGDGGDELFCGYPRYFQTEKSWSSMNSYPLPARRFLASVIQAIPESAIDRLMYWPLKAFTSRNPNQAGERLRRRTAAWSCGNYQGYYRELVSYWTGNSVVVGGREIPYAMNKPVPDIFSGDRYKQMQYLDASCYLPDDILAKVDRAAMANSLETRIPFLDHEFVELAVRIPTSVNLQHRDGKWPLREILKRYVPAEMVERPKQGFAVPLAQWLRNELREWAGDLLSQQALSSTGMFDGRLVQSAWNNHINNLADNSFQLWGLIIFQSWNEYWKSTA